MANDLVQQNVSLASLSTWRVGGPAEYFCSPRTIEEVEAALLWSHQHQQRLTVIGGGSNVLISDKGVRGLVLSTRQLAGLDVKEDQGQLRIVAMGGTHKSQLLRIFIQKKLAPALFLSGLPGDVGGGVVMNAGVGEARLPREFGEIVEWVEVVRLHGTKTERVKIPSEQIRWTYRHSEGWQPGVIVRVGLKWPLEPDDEIPIQVREANRLRLSKQPLDQPSCGSVFVNPSGYKAGAVIDNCGLKGFAIGGAMVSPKHANFIVNTGTATAHDIDAVIKHVQSTVKTLTQVDLKTEVIYLGEWA